MMETTSTFNPIVRNIKTNDVYEYLGGNKFRNLRTGGEGEVDEEKAKDVFKINLDASNMINEYPIIKSLINILNLKLDQHEK